MRSDCKHLPNRGSRNNSNSDTKPATNIMPELITIVPSKQVNRVSFVRFQPSKQYIKCFCGYFSIHVVLAAKPPTAMTSAIRMNVLTSSTCSVVKGPLYFCFPKSI